MKIIRSLNEDFQLNNNTALALGTFDGVHIAHKHVIGSVVKVAKENNLLSVVYTFENHPREFSGKAPKRLITPSQKIEIIKDLGVDVLIIVPFDNLLLNLEAEDFLFDYIVKKIKAKHIIVGYDFRFGKQAKGNVDLLRAHALEYQYDIDIVEPIKYNHVVVSSTMIRNYLLNGDVESANRLLGREYCVQGHIIHGKKMGRKLGFPTINLKTDYEMSVLKPGVYLTETLVKGKVYPSITNVGFNPTFEQRDFTIETFILDISMDLYGEEVKISFINYMREEIKFDNLDDLIKQIEHDVELAKEYFKL